MSKTPENKPKEASGSSFLAELRGSAGGENPQPAKPARRFSSTYILAAVMAALSAGALFGMRAYGKQAGIRITGKNEDFKPVKSETVSAAQTQKVLAELERHGLVPQIPADAIKRNPFVLGSQTPVVLDDRKTTDAERRAREAAERERKEREAAVAEKLRSLEVTSVMMGSRPVVRISGKLYRVGDEVLKTFTVAEINERGVTLELEGVKYELTIKQALNADGSKPEEEADPAARPGRR